MLVVMDEELELTADMQPLDRDVFNYLCQRCDLMTGVIGVSRRVSYGGAALDLSERVQARRRAESLRVVTSKQVENAVSRLVAAGLLRRLSASGARCDLVLVRVFFERALVVSRSVQNRDGRELGGLLVECNGLFNSSINDLQSYEQASREALGDSVGTTLINNNKKKKKKTGDDEFLMFVGWTFDEVKISGLLSKAGFDYAAVDPAWILDHVMYWVVNGRQAGTQEQWEGRLVQRLVVLLRDPDLMAAAVKRPAVGGGKAAGDAPGWASLPRDDAQLMDFSVRCGFGVLPAGKTAWECRKWLEAKIEKRRREVN